MMTKTPDMTKRQFDAACKRHGFRPMGILGYYELSPPGSPGLTSVSVLNAGRNRRAQLAYLLRKKEEYDARQSATRPITINCPCGHYDTVGAATLTEALSHFRRPDSGWNYARPEKDGKSLEGVCSECRELMDEDE